MTKPNVQELARVGAQARLNELIEERDALLKMFPELKEGARRGRKPAGDSTEPVKKPTRKRKPMSAAQKKAVGERMRAYWAKRRVEKANGASEGAQAESASQNGSMSRKATRKAGRKQGRKK